MKLDLEIETLNIKIFQRMYRSDQKRKRHGNSQLTKYFLFCCNCNFVLFFGFGCVQGRYVDMDHVFILYFSCNNIIYLFKNQIVRYIYKRSFIEDIILISHLLWNFCDKLGKNRIDYDTHEIEIDPK